MWRHHVHIACFVSGSALQREVVITAYRGTTEWSLAISANTDTFKAVVISSSERQGTFKDISGALFTENKSETVRMGVKNAD